MLTVTQPTETRVSTRMSQRTFLVLLGGVLAAGAGLRLWLLMRGLPTLDSDESIVGLMALHARAGEFSTFFWGQQYMGSIEALLSVPIFALFGPSALTLRLPMLLLSLGFVATIALLGGWLISRRVGLLAAALVALGSPFFTILSIRAFGGYIETLLFGNLLLWGALRGTRSWRGLALFGLLAGMALWTNFLVLPFLAVAVLIAWWQGRRDLLGWRSLLMVGTTLIGASPAILYNLTHSFATITTIAGLTAPAAGKSGTAGATAAPSAIDVLVGWLQQPWHELTISLPILAGSWFGGTQSAGYSTDMYRDDVAAHPVAYGIALLIALSALALLVSLAVLSLRHWRTLWMPLPEAAEVRRHALRRQYEAAVLLIAVAYLLVFMLSHQGLWAIPRYLFPVFVAVPALIGQFERIGKVLLERFAPLVAQRWLSGVLFIACLPVFIWNVYGCAQLTPIRTAALDHSQWVAQDDRSLLDLLAANNVHTVISNDYWVGLRLTFESGEKVITVMVTPEGHPGFNRYAPYVQRGLRDPRPAHLELRGTAEADLLQQRVASGDLKGYTLQPLGGYLIALPPP